MTPCTTSCGFQTDENVGGKNISSVFRVLQNQRRVIVQSTWDSRKVRRERERERERERSKTQKEKRIEKDLES